MYYQNSTIEAIREELDFLSSEEVDNLEVYSQGLQQIESSLESEQAADAQYATV